MRRSDDRILVTHVGSLPRGDELNDLLIRSELGEGVERAALNAAIEARVAHVFRQQLAAGIDIPNDGEQGRVGFQTYVADRMSGFGGESNRRRPREFSDFPQFADMLMKRFPRRGKQFNAPQAIADVRYKDLSAINREVALLRIQAQSAGKSPSDCFSSSTPRWLPGASRRRSLSWAIASASSPAPIAVSARSPAANGWPRTWCGRSSSRRARAPTSRRSGCGAGGSEMGIAAMTR